MIRATPPRPSNIGATDKLDQVLHDFLGEISVTHRRDLPSIRDAAQTLERQRHIVNVVIRRYRMLPVIRYGDRTLL
jgi:hypothetical protein